MTTCKACGAEIAKSAKSCPHCGAKNKKPPVILIAIAVIILIGIISSIGGGNSSDNSNSSSTVSENNGSQNSSAFSDATNQNSLAPSNTNSKFSGDCGIAVKGEMGTDIIGQPTVTVEITNTSDKDISAIQFYAIPYDVYGEELTGIFTYNKLTTDDTIPAGTSDTRTWQLLDTDVKTVRLYVFSVYFSDGTEWGNKDAGKSTILENALEVQMSSKSGT